MEKRKESFIVEQIPLLALLEKTYPMQCMGREWSAYA